MKYYLDFVYKLMIDSKLWLWINNRNTVYEKILYKLPLFIPVFLYFFFKHINLFIFRKAYTKYVEVPITTKCNLCCEKCANFIPDFKNKEKIDQDNLLDSITNLLDKFDYIYNLRLIGGEPLLNTRLEEIILHIVKFNKAKKIEIVSNGMKLPNESLVKTLSKYHCYYCISDYGFKNINPLLDLLEENNIGYLLVRHEYWLDYGGKKYKKNEEDKVKQLKNCYLCFNSYFNNKLYQCPQSSSLTNLKVIDDICLDFSKDLTKKEIMDFIKNKKYIKACDYCNMGTDRLKKIEVAKQKRNI